MLCPEMFRAITLIAERTREAGKNGTDIDYDKKTEEMNSFELS